MRPHISSEALKQTIPPEVPASTPYPTPRHTLDTFLLGVDQQLDFHMAGLDGFYSQKPL